MTEKMNKEHNLKTVIFKDQICDAKWTKKLMTCCKGSVKLIGAAKRDF